MEWDTVDLRDDQLGRRHTRGPGLQRSHCGQPRRGAQGVHRLAMECGEEALGSFHRRARGEDCPLHL